jgi:DHA1 family bicyclomycin/chloramphenicol resistance-like MFS transporter
VSTPGGRSAAALKTGRILAVLAVITALSPLSMDVYTPSLPDIQADLAASDWLAQASITACLLGIGVGQLVWGPLSDRLGRRPVVLWGVAGWTVLSFVSAVVTTAPELVVVRGLAGLSGAAGIVAARSIVRDLSDDRHALAARIGLLSMVTSLAPVAAPLLGTIVAGLWGWRADFIAITVLGAAISLAFALVVPETLAPRLPADRAPSVLRSLGVAVRNRELLLVSVALAAQSFGFYAYVSTASFVVERQLGLPPAAFALVFGSNALVMFGVNLVFRRLARTRHPSGPLGVGLTASLVGGVALTGGALVWAPPAALWVASTVFAASMGLVLPGAHSWGQLTLVASGAASALAGSAQFLGGVLGSPVTGALGPTAVHLGAVIAVSSAVALVAWRVARRYRSDVRRPRARHG